MKSGLKGISEIHVKKGQEMADFRIKMPITQKESVLQNHNQLDETKLLVPNR